MWTIIILLVGGTVLGHIMRLAINSAADTGASILRKTSPYYAAGGDHLPPVIDSLPDYTPVTPVAPAVTKASVTTTKINHTVESYRKAMISKIKTWWSGLPEDVLGAATADDTMVLTTAVTPEAWEPHVLNALANSIAAEAGIPAGLSRAALTNIDIETPSGIILARMKAANYLAPAWTTVGQHDIPIVMAVAAICEDKNLDTKEVATSIVAAATAISNSSGQPVISVLKAAYSEYDGTWIALKLRAGI